MVRFEGKVSKEATEGAMKAVGKTGKEWAFTILGGFVPVGLGVYAGLGYWNADESEAAEYERKAASVPNLIGMAIPVFVISILCELALDTAWGTKWYRLNDSISSLSAGISQQATGALVKALGIFPYAWLHAHARIMDMEGNSWVAWVAMFVAVELGYYCMHRAAHEWNVGWAGHVVHHSSEGYTLATALRQGILQPVFSWMFYLPYAFVFPLELYLLHNQINTLYQFWIHTQAITTLPLGLEYVFNTPSHHRVHHGRNPQYIDKNYGGSLIVFDRLFGTFEPEDEEVVYGITSSLDTWNPLVAQFHHVQETLDTSIAAAGIWPTIRTWLDYGPAWNWYLGNWDAVRDGTVEEDMVPIRYDARPASGTLSLYCVFSITMAILEIAELIKIQDSVSLPLSSLYAGFIIFHVVALSLVLDNSPWASLANQVQWLAFALLATNPVVREPLSGLGFSFFALSRSSAWGLCILASAWYAAVSPTPVQVDARGRKAILHR